MIFCLPALASLPGKQPYSATFRATLAGPVPLTPKAKRYFLRVTIVGGNAHEEILLRCAQKSNHLTNHTDCLRVNSISLPLNSTSYIL